MFNFLSKLGSSIEFDDFMDIKDLNGYESTRSFYKDA
jgi:hypothetical protein